MIIFLLQTELETLRRIQALALEYKARNQLLARTLQYLIQFLSDTSIGRVSESCWTRQMQITVLQKKIFLVSNWNDQVYFKIDI